jgi:DNA-binding MarR family transcriptional regulator
MIYQAIVVDVERVTGHHHGTLGRQSDKDIAEMSRNQRRKTAQEPWLSAAEAQAWRAFMAVHMRQLQSDSDLSLADYHVLNALSDAPGGRLQVSDLAALIGWERSRASHQLRRLCERGLAERAPSEDDGRATDAILTKAGRKAIEAAAPRHAALVRRLFFDPLPDDLIAPLTAALEHVHVNINFNSSSPPVPWSAGANVTATGKAAYSFPLYWLRVWNRGERFPARGRPPHHQLGPVIIGRR